MPLGTGVTIDSPHPARKLTQQQQTATTAEARISNETGWLLLSRCATSHTLGTPRRASRFTPSRRTNGSMRVPNRPVHHPAAAINTSVATAHPTTRSPLSRPRVIPAAVASAVTSSTSPAIGAPHIPGSAEYVKVRSSTSNPASRNQPAQTPRASASAAEPAGRAAAPMRPSSVRTSSVLTR